VLTFVNHQRFDPVNPLKYGLKYQDLRVTIVQRPTSGTRRQRRKVAQWPVVLLSDRDDRRLAAVTGRMSHGHNRRPVERLHRRHMNDYISASHPPPT